MTSDRAARGPRPGVAEPKVEPKPSTLRTRLLLKPQELRRRIDPETLPGPRAAARHRTHIIGQDRAIQALDLGLRLESPGYNVFLSGPSGSGRMTTARHILGKFKEPRRALHDFVYAHNFVEPDRARLIVLDPGEGVRLARAVAKLVESIRRDLPRVLGMEACLKERDRLLAEFRTRENEVRTTFDNRLRRAGFALVETEASPSVERDCQPVVGGEPRSPALLEQLTAQGKLPARRLKQILRRRHELNIEREQLERRVRLLRRETTKVLENFNRRVGAAIIDNLIEEVREQFDHPEVRDYIGEVREALLERIPELVRQDGEYGTAEDGKAAPPVQADYLAPFSVNVVLSNARRKGCPIVFEHNPSVVRLVGTIERSPDDGRSGETEFMAIRAGALLRADGGFLVVNAEDLLTEPGSWQALKRTISTGLLDVRTPEGAMVAPPSALKPDPIPLNVKIIMLGDEEVYRALYLEEDDFKKVFKVKAEFDTEMELSRSNLEKFMAFVGRVVTQEELLPPTRAAVALLVEEAMRDVEHRAKLSTRFRVIADLLRESTFWARDGGRRRVQPADVQRALDERYRRLSLAEEKYRQEIERDVIVVETSGARVGQVNGLAVFDLGDYSFGKPCRISASVGMGREGLVNIEREAGLSGETYDKGVLIVAGFLRNRFGGEFPLAVEASVCFEQSYGAVDGDSASSTEVYAILSALAALPIAQGIAVTGSVSQQGDVQPIGGVNQKIEGFFDICTTRGLDGLHGVVIPRRNVPNLMLKRSVIEAVRRGQFHIWAISTIDEGMEILTGVAAGQRDAHGVFPPGTINRRVEDRLRHMAEEMKSFR
ncbi:MAG TPA: AAA family ATPase [Polyangia bacterium]